MVSRPPTHIEDWVVSHPKKTEVQKAGAPTPAGPCCTIGTVGDEVATSVENMATMSGSSMKTLATFDAGTHGHRVLADGGLTGPSPAAAVTGFAGFAALVTLKASLEIIREQSARQQSAQGVLANVQRYQRVRQEGVNKLFEQDFVNEAARNATNPQAFISQLNVNDALAWVQQEIDKSQAYEKIVQMGQRYRESLYHKALWAYANKPHRCLKAKGVQALFAKLGLNDFEKIAWSNFLQVLRVKNALGYTPANNKAWVLEQMQKTLQKKKDSASDEGRLSTLNAIKDSDLRAAINFLENFDPVRSKSVRCALDLHKKHGGSPISDQTMFLRIMEDGFLAGSEPSPERHGIADTLDFLKKYIPSEQRQDAVEPNEADQKQLTPWLGAPADGQSWADHLQQKQNVLESHRDALETFSKLDAKARGQAKADRQYHVDYFLKPLKACFQRHQQAGGNPTPLAASDAQFLQQCLEVRDAENLKQGQPYQTSEEKAMAGFLRDGIFEARSEKIIPGYLAAVGITLLALGRVVLAALPLGQLVLSGYSAANMVMAARDCKHSFAKLKTIRAKLASQGTALDADPRKQAWQAVERHYRKMSRWALAGTLAWAFNTVGMLAMTAVNTVKWVAALLAAPFTFGLSIGSGVVTGHLLGWMSLTMFAATASVAGAAFVAVPANLKLRGRTYTPLKPPKVWGKLPNSRGDEVLAGHQFFTQDEVEEHLVENTHQHGVVRGYRESFFASLGAQDRSKIQRHRWAARLVMWGSLGALSGLALRMKFNNKVAAVRCLKPNAENWQTLYTALHSLKKQGPEVQGEAVQTNAEQPAAQATTQPAAAFTGTLTPAQFSAYMDQIKSLPCVGDIAKILARSLTVHSKNILEAVGGDVKTIRNRQAQAVFNAHALKAMGESIAGCLKAKEFLSFAGELAHFGPCCETTPDGVSLLDALQELGESNPDLQPFLRNAVFQAAAQYLVYQRRKEIKEERAEWAELYMHLDKHIKSQAPSAPTANGAVAS